MFNASHNHISIVNKYQFEDFLKLRILDLSQNAITELDSNLFDFVRNIESLNMSHNKIVTIESDILTSLSNLRTLDLSSNRLSSDNFIDASNRLLFLNLSDNHYKSFNISKLYGLNEIQFYNNPWDCKWLIGQMTVGDDRLFFGQNFTISTLNTVLEVPGIDCDDNGMKRSIIVLDSNHIQRDQIDVDVQVSESVNNTRDNEITHNDVDDEILINSHKNITITSNDNDDQSILQVETHNNLNEQQNSQMPNAKFIEDPFDAKSIIIWLAVALIVVFGLVKFGRHVLTKSERKTEQWRRSQQVSYYTPVSVNNSETASADYVSFYVV